MNFKELLKIAINASIQGGDVILDVYSSNFEVKQKEDDSPLTLADQNCNTVIEKHLVNTNIPILIYSKPQEFVNTYEVGILETGKYTQIIIEKIKEVLLREGILENRKAENFDYEELKKAYVTKVKE